MRCRITNEERRRLTPLFWEGERLTQGRGRLGRVRLLQHTDETVAPVVLHRVVREWVQQADR